MGEGGVSPSEYTAYLSPALSTFGFLSVCLLWHLPLPPWLRFLGQACAGHKRWRLNRDLTARYQLATGEHKA
jgi:hypothetical protein